MKKGKLAFAVCLLCVVLLWVLWGNRAVEINTYELVKENLPKTFDGFRVAHISDLHNAELDEENETLLTLLRQAEPDMIAITGDMIDSRRTDTESALEFAERAVQIAPCYYVTGNHEERVPQEYAELKNGLIKLGVAVLENDAVLLEREGESILIAGVNDPSFETDYLFGDERSVIEKYLNELVAEKGCFSLLLSHRPELFELYSEVGVSLALAGHAHGGQFRLPFIGGLYAPHQGFLPEYDSGIYNSGETTMVVSRGIGNSIITLRFNNRPEVIIIELTR